ncbi:MAG TPA: hypothetical protein VKA64_04985 [Gammaproteobacteria bacterium]|nr:hypothetical protein [Gammaproteobacteria bacterium]
MAVYDETKGGTGRVDASMLGHTFVMKAVLDMELANGGSGLSSGDAAKVLNLPTNHHVLSVRAKVLEAEGGTLTLDVGTSGNATAFHSNLDGNTTSTEAISTSAVSGVAADDIRVTADNAADKARIEVTALVADLNPDG